MIKKLPLILVAFFVSLLTFSAKSQCNTNTTICTPGVAGPFNFIPASNNPSSCLDFINGSASPNYAYIILYITQGGDLNLLIEGDANNGFLDVSIFDITGENDPCGSLGLATEIGCNYADFQNGCNQFGTDFPCTSTVPAPVVNTGDVLMILVEDWDNVMTNFTLELGSSPGSAQTGPPDATINTPPTVCATGSPIQITAVDNGGTWSGPGMSPDGIFDPSLVGVGTYTIDYVIGQPPCQSTGQATIDVIDCTVPTPCPYYDNTPIAEYKACGNQIYDFTVLNTACPAVVCFDVVGNYGSPYASEITWEVLSVTTGNVVASGGPGSNNGNIFVPVCVDPNIEGGVFNLIVYDSYGDGFDANGYIQIEDNSVIIAGPIAGNFGSQANQVFASNIDISPTTLTITTPSGNVVNNIGNCADHSVQFVLTNNNYCTPISVDMPWQIECDLTGNILSSGIHTVVIYPQIASASSDVVDITWNAGTCQWDVVAQNDCDQLDIGTIFTISPDPTAWPANTCSGGSQDFTIDYLGVVGSPDCCSTGGPLSPIVYNTSTVYGDAVVVSSPYGGTNNAAYTTIPANGAGGVSTSFSLTITGTNFCFDPPSTEVDYTYYIGVWIDGVQVLLNGPNCCNNSNFSVTVTQADLLAAGVIYDENSVVEVYVLPNLFWSDPCFPFTCPIYTTFVPNATCAGLGDGDWTLDDLTITLDATFIEQIPGPANCSFVTPSAYTCCVVDMPTASNPAPIVVQCPSDVPVADPAVVTDEASPCNPVVTLFSETSDNNSCAEIITRVYRVTDDCGNFTDVTQTITVDDNINPTASNPAPLFYECLGDVPAANPAVVTDEADNCSTPLVAFVSESQSGTCPIVITRIYSVTDDCGNSINVTHTITVEDAQDPTATAPANANYQCIGDVPPASAADITNETDNCTVAPLVVYNGETSVGTCPTIITRTWDISDECGNTITVSQTITVLDNIAPVLDPAPLDLTVECVGDVPAAVDLNWTDNCDGSGVVSPVEVPLTGGACGGTITRTWSYTDACGNNATVTQTITVDDNTPPTASNPIDISIAGGSPPLPDPLVVTDEADNCDPNPTVEWVSDVSDNGSCPEIITRTYRIYDACGNETFVTQLIYIGDPNPPTASDPAQINVECLSNVPAPNVAVVTDAADVEGGVTITFETESITGGSCPDTLTRVYRVTDDCGNFIFVNQLIIMEPTTAPVMPGSGGAAVSCEANAIESAVVFPVITDVCGNTLSPSAPVITDAPNPVTCEGTRTFTYTYTDCAGNNGTWDFVFTITVPAFTISDPAGAEAVNCQANADGTNIVVPSVNDACGTALVATGPVITDAPNPVTCEGTRTYTYTFTDCANNSATWDYVYTISVPAFTITDPAGAEAVNCEANADGTNIVVPAVNDACGTALVPTGPVITDSPNPVTCEGTRTYTYTYTDCAGNSATWDYVYTISVPAFTITDPAGAEAVVCEANADGTNIITPSVNDACGVALVPTGPVITDSPNPVTCEGTRTYTYTYTDCAGNSATWDYVYTITVPAFTIPYPDGSATVNCPVDGTDPGAPGPVTDTCGNTLTPVITAPNPAGCSGGTMDWIYTYTDCAGNSAVWTYAYTVTMPAFSISDPAGAEAVVCESNADGSGIVTPSIMDMCGNSLSPTGPLITDSPNPVTCEGTRTYTYTYTDCAGNTDTWDYVYTISVPAFTITAPNGSASVECIGDVTIPNAPAITDTCGNALTPVMTENADPVCSGDKIYTFTYTDCAGNTADWTFTYSINDNINPTASNPDTLVVAVGGIPAEDVTVVTDEADNCTTNPIVAWVDDVSDGNQCPETITRTYSVTDDCGNQIFVTQIIIVESDCEVTIPTAISPDGDDINDRWEIIDLDQVYPSNTVRIYNRWGSLIFENINEDGSKPNTDPNNQWDGTYNGNPLPTESYYFIIEGTRSDGVTKDQFTGAVTILNKN